MMSRVTSLGKFDGFRVNDHSYFEILKFVDDIMLLGDGSLKDIWSVKAPLRGFELAAGLRVNLTKSRLMGVKLNSDFIQAVSSFLNCEIGSTSFIFWHSRWNQP